MLKQSQEQHFGGETASRNCPKCHSNKIWKDGKRKTQKTSIQRFICRKCGYRFSESTILSTNSRNTIRRQVCAYKTKVAKNLTKVENQTNKALRESTAETKGLLVSLSFWMLKEGYRETTINLTHQKLKHLIKIGATLSDQDSIKQVIANQKSQEGTKVSYVNSYERFCKMQRIQFDKPRYRYSHQKLPFIPTETELDQLIAGVSRKMSVFLQFLKETGVRSGEATITEWKHLDFVTKTVRVNNPEKHGNTRMLKISDKLISMLKGLPQNQNKVFSGSVHGIRSNFTRQRQRIAQKLKNPRINRISFHTFRHWKATMTYHKTKDILYVKKLLGHKSINSTLLYTQLISFEGDEFDVKVAESKKERIALLEAGFEWIGKDNDGLTYFRKRK